MKIILLALMFFYGCEKAGTVESISNQGTIDGRSVKVFRYCIGDGEWIKVVLLEDSNPIGVTYRNGKVDENITIINNIQATTTKIEGCIVSENDSIVIIRKGTVK